MFLRNPCHGNKGRGGVLAALACACMAWPLMSPGQVTVSQTTLTGFSVPNAIGGGAMTEYTYDQQTGQGADDYVGDGTGGYYGFYYAPTQIDFGSGSVNAMVFRFRLNLVASSFTGNIRLGVDGNEDGKVDLYFGISTGAGQVPEIVFQNPTGTAPDANTSPNTSALGTSYGAIATNSTNFSYIQAPDGSQYYTNKPTQPNPDMWLTFALPFSTLASTLGAQTGTTIDWSNSYLAFVAFSSTQGNAVNQDVYGIPNLTSTVDGTKKGTPWGDVTYSNGGGFTEYFSASGAKKPVPEPATVWQLTAFLVAGLMAGRRRLRRAVAGWMGRRRAAS